MTAPSSVLATNQEQDHDQDVICRRCRHAVTGVSLALSALGQTDDSKLGARCISRHRARRKHKKLFGPRHALPRTPSGTALRRKTFDDVLKADPQCGIAYWGIALSLLWDPHAMPPAKRSPSSAAALAKAQSVERQDRTRARLSRGARRAAIRRLRQGRSPHAPAGLRQRPWNTWPRAIRTATKRRSAMRSRSTPRLRRPDKAYANQLKGAAILEEIAKRQPEHPRRGALPDPSLRLSAARRERHR